MIVGFVTLTHDELEQLMVDAAARGTGVAVALLAFGAQRLLDAGHSQPWLAVVTGNARARHFYEREGWRDAGHLDYDARAELERHADGFTRSSPMATPLTGARSIAGTRRRLAGVPTMADHARRRERPMIQVRVAGVALDASGQHVMLLKPIDEIPGDGLLLPIWIGQLEATSILIAVEQAPVPRPLAHDLMRTLLETLGAEVTRVEITQHRRRHLLRRDHAVDAAGERVVDARPSDAVALASRVGAPIWVADAVMAEAGVPDTLTEAAARTSTSSGSSSTTSTRRTSRAEPRRIGSFLISQRGSTGWHNCCSRRIGTPIGR